MAEKKISKLSDILANKIAAGEVVERPSSVVKELVENAIDASANQIKIFIEAGGKKIIQVIDNGSGIISDELNLAFERHATSKIHDEIDLETISTLGFRGEALPSIASVSQIELKTKSQNTELGSIISLSGGMQQGIRKVAANMGTSIAVKNLFFNTPARRKFLKSDSAENQHILNVLKRFFLAYPDIEFDLFIDQKEIFSLKKATLKQRIFDVFGKQIADDLLPLSTSLGGIEIEGFISKPYRARKSRTHQHLFLNGRPIVDKNINYSIYQGYGETLPEGSHPVYCLFIKLDPGFVDVNIHPTKMYVRFTNDRSLFYLFLNAIKKTLNASGLLADFSSFAEGSAIQKVNMDSVVNPEKSNGDKKLHVYSEFQNRSPQKKQGEQISLAYFEASSGLKQISRNTPERSFQPIIEDNLSGVKFWQVHNKYIFSEIRSGLVVVNQHLAHARILYEKTLKALNEKKNVNAQKLLFPQKITLAMDDFLLFKEIDETLKVIGFTINIFSGNTIIIEAMPADVKIGRESQILMDIIDYYKKAPSHSFNHNEKIAAAYAFKNAVKTGDILSEKEMHNLVDQLFACEEPFYAPNGKPIITSLDLDELERKFK